MLRIILRRRLKIGHKYNLLVGDADIASGLKVLSCNDQCVHPVTGFF